MVTLRNHRTCEKWRSTKLWTRSWNTFRRRFAVSADFFVPYQSLLVSEEVEVRATVNESTGEIQVLTLEKSDCHKKKSSSKHERSSTRFRLTPDGHVTVDTEKQWNPWAAECQCKVVERMLKEREPTPFLLLENVVALYTRPCVLDLKIGTRQHGDDASESKRHRQLMKCRHSTSATLGVRMVGMQMWEADTKTYSYVEKQEGRRIDAAGFKGYVKRFVKCCGRSRAARIRQKWVMVMISGQIKIIHKHYQTINLTQTRQTTFLARWIRGIPLFLSLDPHRFRRRSSWLIKWWCCQSVHHRFRTLDFLWFLRGKYTLVQTCMTRTSYLAVPILKSCLQDLVYSGADEGCLLGIDSIVEAMETTQVVVSQSFTYSGSHNSQFSERSARLNGKQHVELTLTHPSDVKTFPVIIPKRSPVTSPLPIFLSPSSRTKWVSILIYSTCVFEKLTVLQCQFLLKETFGQDF